MPGHARACQITLTHARASPQGEGVAPQSGREVVMDWLAALADANYLRTGGGEMGALRSVGLGERAFAPGGRRGSGRCADARTPDARARML